MQTQIGSEHANNALPAAMSCSAPTHLPWCYPTRDSTATPCCCHMKLHALKLKKNYIICGLGHDTPGPDQLPVGRWLETDQLPSIPGICTGSLILPTIMCYQHGSSSGQGQCLVQRTQRRWACMYGRGTQKPTIPHINQLSINWNWPVPILILSYTFLRSTYIALFVCILMKVPQTTKLELLKMPVILWHSAKTRSPLREDIFRYAIKHPSGRRME